MFQLPALTVPMGSTALQAAAEALTRQSGALTDLARALAAYEAATGLCRYSGFQCEAGVRSRRDGAAAPAALGRCPSAPRSASR